MVLNFDWINLESVFFLHMRNIYCIIANPLNYCGLVAPYGDRDMGQHWLR